MNNNIVGSYDIAIMSRVLKHLQKTLYSIIKLNTVLEISIYMTSIFFKITYLKIKLAHPFALFRNRMVYEVISAFPYEDIQPD